MADNFPVPILFLIFNRPESARTVFDEIKKQKPKYLFIAADGPRNIPGEKEKCFAAREIVNQVDWDCELKTLFREENLGCGKAVSSAITWFFENVTEGIVLEDDCLPDPSFFRYCQELLKQYRDNDKIAVINGSNYLFGKFNVKDSYYFSRYPHIWGWATWRRTWEKYDFNIKQWPAVRDNGQLQKIFENITSRYYWTQIFNDVFAGKINTWDYQLAFQCFINNWYSITPAVNLISNVGFGGTEATHTKSKGGKFSEMKKGSLDFPLRHPETVERFIMADDYIQRNNFCWWKMFIKKSLPPPLIKLIRR